MEDILPMLGHKAKPVLEHHSSEAIEENEAKEFDEAIETAFRYGDFEDIYQLIFENGQPVNYQVNTYTSDLSKSDLD